MSNFLGSSPRRRLLGAASAAVLNTIFRAKITPLTSAWHFWQQPSLRGRGSAEEMPRAIFPNVREYK